MTQDYSIMSPEEILQKFVIEISASPDTAELQRLNSEVANRYQEASIHYTKAQHINAKVTRKYNATRDEFTLEVAQEERKKKREERLAADERKAEASKRLNNDKVSDQLESSEYYMQTWNTVLRNLKFVSGRIGDAIIEDASEKKLLTAVRASHSEGEGNRTSIWRSGPAPDGL